MNQLKNFNDNVLVAHFVALSMIIRQIDLSTRTDVDFEMIIEHLPDVTKCAKLMRIYDDLADFFEDLEHQKTVSKPSPNMFICGLWKYYQSYDPIYEYMSKISSTGISLSEIKLGDFQNQIKIQLMYAKEISNSTPSFVGSIYVSMIEYVIFHRFLIDSSSLLFKYDL